ncbi:MAG: N-acetylmannosamine-6-phosphate 2-epimerase [Angelakisella sp.]
MMKNINVFELLRGGLVVSCQALPEEPLHSSFIMSRMAVAALRGGAIGIRANTVVDIAEIKKVVDLPVIGIIKQVYDDSDVYITPTMVEVDALVTVGAEIIAMDATNRLRTEGRTLDNIFAEVRQKYPNQLYMADCSTIEEGLHAVEIGFDCVGTTMSGYTPYTKGTTLPNLDMIHELALRAGVPVIAEGGIHYPEQLHQALEAGALCAVVGGAITRPMEITQRFVAVLDKR